MENPMVMQNHCREYQRQVTWFNANDLQSE